MQNIAKVSSVEYMRTLTGRALPGIPLEFSLLPPAGLPNRPNSYHFRLDLSSPQWTEIQKNQSICLYWDQAPKDTKAEFVVIRK
jgi:type VI secretion system protein ImpJ